MTHFHYYEDEAMHCNRWFCPLENRVEDIMDTFAVIENFRRRSRIVEVPDTEVRLASEAIVEVEQKSFKITVASTATKEEARSALYELAVLRWRLHGPSASNENYPLEDIPGLPVIFSYLDENDATVYFFNSEYSSIPRGWNPSTHSEVSWLNEVPDNKVKITVQKLPTVAAKKLFNRD